MLVCVARFILYKGHSKRGYYLPKGKSFIKASSPGGFISQKEQYYTIKSRFEKKTSIVGQSEGTMLRDKNKNH